MPKEIFQELKKVRIRGTELRITRVDSKPPRAEAEGRPVRRPPACRHGPAGAPEAPGVSSAHRRSQNLIATSPGARAAAIQREGVSLPGPAVRVSRRLTRFGIGSRSRPVTPDRLPLSLSADPERPMSSSAASRKFRRIATEEAFSGPRDSERSSRGRALAGELPRPPAGEADLRRGPADTPRARLRSLLLDLEEQRLRDMDDNGVDVQLLLLTAPGVQMFDADTATDLATVANDRLAELISRHPTRFAGLASFAPHSPKRAAKEMERAMRQLELNGFVVNSHTNGEYLDDTKFWPCSKRRKHSEGCSTSTRARPPKAWLHPSATTAWTAAMWAYGVETATHAVRMILGGVFDRFPQAEDLPRPHGRRGALLALAHRLQSALGTSRRACPQTAAEAQRVLQAQLRHHDERPGVPHLALDFSIKALGADNVIWAIDYPYQPSAPAVAFMDSAPISDEDKAKIYHRNAERVFHIK